MKVLVIGGGGREHALVWKLKQSPRVEKIWCVPETADRVRSGVPAGRSSKRGGTGGAGRTA